MSGDTQILSILFSFRIFWFETPLKKAHPKVVFVTLSQLLLTYNIVNRSKVRLTYTKKTLYLIIVFYLNGQFSLYILNCEKCNT